MNLCTKKDLLTLFSFKEILHNRELLLNKKALLLN